MSFTLKNPAAIRNIKQNKAEFFTTKKGKKHFMEQKRHPLLLFKSVPFSLCKYYKIMTNTRTIYLSCYVFIYNIQVKTFLKIYWKKCILGLDSNAALAGKWLKIYIILQHLQLFFENQSFSQLLQLSGHSITTSSKKFPLNLTL